MNVFFCEPGMSVPEDITIEAMAECTKEAMDELGIKDFVLMGVSMGGMIAQELTLRHPEMVSKLILCSTADHIPESSRELINKWIGFAENRDGIGLCNAFAEHVYTKEYAEKYSAAFEMFRKGNDRGGMSNGFKRGPDGVKSLGTTNRLEQISCPVFVIAGREDRIFSAETQKCLAEKTRGEYCLYEHYAHAVYDEAPDIKEKILNWCMEH
jgi:Predicted hydrolases or acyltransferases (alpha/beta hydrolase superfamily)